MADLEEPQVNGQAKWLLKLVYIMGGVLVLLFIAVIVGLFFKLKKPAAPPVPVASVALNFTGADVNHIDLDGNRLAIAAAHEIVVIEVSSGKVLSRIPLK